MKLPNLIYHSIEFTFLIFIYNIRAVFSYHGLICRYLYNIQIIYGPEFIFLGLCSTRHAGKLLIHPEIVLEGYGCQSLAFSLYLYPFLCLNGLMQAIAVPPSIHKPSGEFIYYYYFSVLNHIIDIIVHQRPCF
ncbi:hypothetical protein SDC9_150190 [bioreactor metagenome]|uniref:Uncharacterized protein n=1 Tax=bioreactor metagenome TaxID=1076179 RepID=A0A645EP96_9ZZZZ